MTGKLWTADELARHHFAHTFLIEPIILRGGIVLLHGKRGIGKSLFALTLATCLSERGTLFGRYPTNPLGPIVYVQADVPPWLTQARVRRAQTLYSLSNIYFFFPSFLNMVTWMPDDETVRAIGDLSPALVVWDTLRKIHRLNSNDDDVPSLIYGHARELFPKTTHLFVHHDKKTIVDQEQLEAEEEFRGSGAWIDDAHTGLHLVEVSTGRLMLYFTKTNACEDQPSIPLTTNIETLLLYASGEHTTRLVNWWKQKHGQQKEQLEQFLLGSFVQNPRIVHRLVYGGE